MQKRNQPKAIVADVNEICFGVQIAALMFRQLPFIGSTEFLDCGHRAFSGADLVSAMRASVLVFKSTSLGDLVEPVFHFSRV